MGEIELGVREGVKSNEGLSTDLSLIWFEQLNGGFRLPIGV